MESLRRAARLRDLQAANRRRLGERDVSAEDLPDLISEAYKTRGNELSGSVATPFVLGVVADLRQPEE